MPGMPEVMAKPLMLERLDEVLSDPARRDAYMNDLESGGDLLTVSKAHGIVVTPLEERHMREDWFRTWWPKAQLHPGGIKEIMRRGFMLAIEEARQRKLPVDCYWVCDPAHEEHAPGHGEHTNGGGHKPEDGEVEVSISWSAYQITLILQTPHPPVKSLPGTVLEDILVIRRHGDDIVKAQASRPKEQGDRLPRPEPHRVVA